MSEWTRNSFLMSDAIKTSGGWHRWVQVSKDKLNGTTTIYLRMQNYDCEVDPGLVPGRDNLEQSET